MPAQQPPGALDGVADVEQLADQCLDPAQGPALVPGEPVRQRAFPQLQLQPGPLPRRQPLPRHRPPGPQRRRAAIPPGLPPPPHRPLRHPQIRGDLRGAVAAGEPPGRLQPPPLPPLLRRAYPRHVAHTACSGHTTAPAQRHYLQLPGSTSSRRLAQRRTVLPAEYRTPSRGRAVRRGDREAGQRLPQPRRLSTGLLPS